MPCQVWPALALPLPPGLPLGASLLTCTTFPDLPARQVAVTLGILPQELLDASLQTPSRVTLPRAPPHTLLLSDCQFHCFPAVTGGIVCVGGGMVGGQS